MPNAPRKSFAIYAITKHGLEIGAKLYAALPGADFYVSRKFLAAAPAGAIGLELPMGPQLAATFTRYDCHLHIISVGAVVRMIAPLLKNKKVDPAVVCIDDAARFAVCLLSGHVGRGNDFTQRVAALLAAAPVITTASDVRGTLQVDILGRDLGWRLDDPDRNVTVGCAAVVNAAPVMLVQETGEANWWGLDKPLPAGVAYTTDLAAVDPAAYEMLLIVSDRLLEKTHPDHYAKAVIYRPKSLVLGLGCDRDTPFELLERGVISLLEKHGLALSSVKAIASIDKKADEVGLLALAKKYGWEFLTWSAEELDVVPGIENPSEVVKKYVGTRAVGEPAALLGAGAKTLLVPKQKYTESGAGRNMTLAVARIPFAARAAEVTHV